MRLQAGSNVAADVAKLRSSAGLEPIKRPWECGEHRAALANFFERFGSRLRSHRGRSRMEQSGLPAPWRRSATTERRPSNKRTVSERGREVKQHVRVPSFELIPRGQRLWRGLVDRPHCNARRNPEHDGHWQAEVFDQHPTGREGRCGMANNEYRCPLVSGVRPRRHRV